MMSRQALFRDVTAEQTVSSLKRQGQGQKQQEREREREEQRQTEREKKRKKNRDREWFGTHLHTAALSALVWWFRTHPRPHIEEHVGRAASW